MKTFREYIFESKTQELEKRKAELELKIEDMEADEKQDALAQIIIINDKLRSLLN